MKPLNLLCFLSLAAFMLSSCNSIKPFYGKEYQNWRTQAVDTTAPRLQRIYLVGDAGKVPKKGENPVFVALKSQLDRNDPNSTVVFLGDNIYPLGLRDSAKNPEHYQHDRKALDWQLDIVKGIKGNIYFCPGNHDWANGQEEGLANVRREEAYIKRYLGRPDVLWPENGCPGPHEVRLPNNLTLLFMNTQWWLHGKEKPKNDCPSETDEHFVKGVAEALARNKDRQVVLMAHHPFYTNSTHGGHIPFKHYMFPLLVANKYLWIPLPPLGLVYGLYRSAIGNIQDLPHKRYKALKKALLPLMNQHPNLIFAAGHDHNLQYRKKDGIHHIISGAGSKQDYVAQGHGAAFTHYHKGYFVLDYYANGRVVLETYEPDANAKPILMFRTVLY